VQLLQQDDPGRPGGDAGTAVTVGTFDGLHRGHVDVLGRLVTRARAAARASLLVTFEPHPLELLNPPAAPMLLSTRAEKLELLQATGLDFVAILPFDRALADLPADAFVTEVLEQRFAMRELLIGHDHGFGRGREGDVRTLQALGESRGFGVEVVAPVRTADGEPVSSSRVRRALAEGRLDDAAVALGRRYSVRGTVVPGEERGRALGYPTLNVLSDSPRKLLPPDGVYAVEVQTRRGRFGGMMNLGARPTFQDARRTIEAHLFDVAGDFYGDVVQVGFVARLRETQRFDGVDALVAQLGVDARDARRALTASAEPGNLSGSMQFPPSSQ
jgi:riboflavin kinase/FMN adenylyltransferase